MDIRKGGGRARRGQRAVVKVPNRKGPNLRIVGYISSTGLEFWQRKRGAFKREDFLAFLRQCFRVVVNNGHNMEDDVVVMDNAPAHSRCEELMTEQKFLGRLISRFRDVHRSPDLTAPEFFLWMEESLHHQAPKLGTGEKLRCNKRI
ncbi:hypothetical protein C0J52_06415 [Blattella germanica]|nr:hypothetical protein C0J52_06415 [Blattella germanica]